MTCSHSRAAYLAAVNLDQLEDQCLFVGYKCENYEKFKRGLCTSCGSGNCAFYYSLGGKGKYGYQYLQQKSKRSSGKYYFQTGSKYPWCGK